MSDVFEKNIARLVKESALPLTDERRARARAEFLRATEAPAPRSRARLIGVAAAVLIFSGVLYETTTRPLPKLPPPPEDADGVRKRLRGPEWTDLKGQGGNPVIQGAARLGRPLAGNPGWPLEFKGRAALPDGFFLLIRLDAAEEQLRGGVLTSVFTSLGGGETVAVTKGRFEFGHKLSGPTQLNVEVFGGSGLQDQPVLEQTKTTEVDRHTAFWYHAWDQSLLAKLEPQLEELAVFAREGRDLVARIEAACAAETTFREQEKKLSAEAAKLQARAEAFAESGLYSAASRLLAYTLRDLANSLQIFKWTNGKLEGPVSYYTNGKPGKLHRGDEFSFDALRRYLDDVVLVSGREFDLWILREHDRTGWTLELGQAIDLSGKRPGVAEFATALKALSPQASETQPALDAAIRKISK
jgi:hypothetical protein